MHDAAAVGGAVDGGRSVQHRHLLLFLFGRSWSSRAQIFGRERKMKWLIADAWWQHGGKSLAKDP